MFTNQEINQASNLAVPVKPTNWKTIVDGYEVDMESSIALESDDIMAFRDLVSPLGGSWVLLHGTDPVCSRKVIAALD